MTSADSATVLSIQMFTLRPAKSAGQVVKFGGGFYCGKLAIESKEPIYCFNAFFMTMRAKFTAPTASIHYYVVTLPPALSWAACVMAAAAVAPRSIAATLAFSSSASSWLARWATAERCGRWGRRTGSCRQGTSSVLGSVAVKLGRATRNGLAALWEESIHDSTATRRGYGSCNGEGV